MYRTNLQAFSTATPPQHPHGPTVPSIRLISATPSAAGNSSTSSIAPNPALGNSWGSIPIVPSPLAPKSELEGARKRLVPKKSKLGLLSSVGVGSSRDKEKERGKDLSDVVRRLGVNEDSASARGGFEIYVDPTMDDELGEILLVKKKKSRLGLDGMKWGGNAGLEEVTNVPRAPAPKDSALLKVKEQEGGKEGKWWSIGRGRKDSKEKQEEKARAKSPAPAAAIVAPREPYPRSKTPEPLRINTEPTSSRARFNSLDSGILLSTPITMGSVHASPRPQLVPMPMDIDSPTQTSYPTPLSRAPTPTLTPTSAGFLAPPQLNANGHQQKEGSIAIRAMRSVRSLARMGSWAQLRNDENAPPGTIKEKSKSSEKEKKSKSKEEGKKEKKKPSKPKEAKTKEEEEAPKKKKSKPKPKEDGLEPKKSKKEKRGKETSQTLRLSTSSFEVGSASPLRPLPSAQDSAKTLGRKKHSILGLGLPGTMRLPTLRNGSTASSIISSAAAPPRSSSLSYNKVSSEVAGAIGPDANRLSVESARILSQRTVQGRDRAGSVVSTSTTNSSLRPLSTTSSMSGSRISSGSSVRWDEGCLENGRELRKKERAERKASGSSSSEDGKKSKRRSTEEERKEGRRRTPLSEVFPLFGRSGSPPPPARSEPPILTVESATSDGHGGDYDESIYEDGDVQSVKQEVEIRDHDMAEEGVQKLATPVKRARPRPVSEQLLGKSRPKPMYEGSDGVLSILDAATNDLAQLINHLDLEATPNTPDMTPLRPSSSRSPGDTDTYDFNESPTKHRSTKKPHLFAQEQDSPGTAMKRKSPHHVPSVASIRPYAQSRKYTAPMMPMMPKGSTEASDVLIGQQIASWPTLLKSLSPVKPQSPKASAPTSSNATPVQMLRMTHKRTLTPGPEPEPSPVFHPLRPAKSRNALATLRAPFNAVLQKQDTPPAEERNGTVRAPSLRTFGSHSHSGSSASDSSDMIDSRGPVFKRLSPGQTRQRSSLVPMDVDLQYDDDNDTVPIPPEARRILGMNGTMGGSDVSGYNVPDLDVSDPDSDIPDELQNILSGHSEDGDTMSYRDDLEGSVFGSPIEPDMPVPPPLLELPKFHAQLIDEEANHADIEAGAGSSDEDNTRKSFDFTGEIKRLNESGGSDRRSFVEQLENAFRTPAKIDLKKFGGSFLSVPAPPVPPLPLHLSGGDRSQTSSSDTSSSVMLDSFSDSGLVDMKEPTFLMMTTSVSVESEDKSNFEMFSGSQIVDIKEPTLLPGSDSLVSSDGSHDDVVMLEDSSTSRSLSSSTGSRPSDGQLNTSFKFGGLPKASAAPARTNMEKPQTLSDIIPPPSHVRSLSMSSIVEDDSVLNSIYAQASEVPRPRVRLNSDSSTKQRTRERPVQYRHSRHSSGMSFGGFDSFDEVRRGFEFSNDQPFYPPPVAARRNHSKQESLFSIASVSSYGRAHDYGLPDPFDYGLPSLRERPSSEDMSISMSMSVDDTFSFLDHQPRRRVESDASSFYFKAPMQSFNSRGHRRHESTMSTSSQAPPVSLYNRSFGTHRRNDSSSSAQSVALSYAMHGANGGRAAWARHQHISSIDSVNSDFSMMRLGRPGIGDKMFDTAMDQGVPLTAISASPPESVAGHRSEYRSSFDYDSIMDNDRRSSMEDSLFEKTGDRSSVSSDSVFGGDDYQVPSGGLMLPPQYRPLSVLSMNSVHSPMREDDTMISMLGGGHVRRRSIDASPCVRMEKRKHSSMQGTKGLDHIDYRETPNKARIVEKPSIASTSSFAFGGERMIKAKHGLLERQSLEDSCLIAEGEDLTSSFHSVPRFSRPGPATRSRSSTCTSSSGGDTPPLSSSDGFSSMDEGSQSSIDLSQIDIALANATYPQSTLALRARTRARGHGHRRRASHARASRSSVYETIEEEISNSPSPARMQKNSPTICQPVFIVEPDTVDTSPEYSIWDDESGIVALRKYYALKDEAQTTVVESKRTWRDTPFSVFAVQSFDPPKHPAGMQALLEHSVQNYGPLSSELRPRRIRSRTSSRPSPYPQARVSKVINSPSPNKVQPGKKTSVGAPVLQSLPVNGNVISIVPSLEALKPFSPLVVDIEPKRENAFGLAPHARPRVASTARRTALGWAKRSTGKSSTDQKENIGHGTIMTPGESLRINRPRPRGRPTPASTARPIRV